MSRSLNELHAPIMSSTRNHDSSVGERMYLTVSILFSTVVDFLKRLSLADHNMLPCTQVWAYRRLKPVVKSGVAPA